MVDESAAVFPRDGNEFKRNFGQLPKRCSGREGGGEAIKKV